MFGRNLKSMDNVDIVNTFALHENILTKMFHKNLPFPDHRVESQSKLNYLLVLNEVVTPEQQVVMYHKLRDTLTGETNSISSNVRILSKYRPFRSLTKIFLSISSMKT